jgi:hypothetical protein
MWIERSTLVESVSLRMDRRLLSSHLKSMSNWKNIRLELARTKGFPAGSVGRGYLIRLPLDDNDFVDEEALQRSPHRATVRRYWSTEPDESGLLVRMDGGWAMHCDGRPVRMLELDDRPVRLGQQIAVEEPGGVLLPFRIAGVR